MTDFVARGPSSSLELTLGKEYGNKLSIVELFKGTHKDHGGQLIRRPSADALRVRSESRVLVLFTGGTIGMLRGSGGGYEPKPNMLEAKLRSIPHLHDKEYAEAHFRGTLEASYLVLPDRPDAQRVVYTIREYNPVLDSSNMTMDDWIRIAQDIERFYSEFDGFVVLHGTDTLAYTASALSFMLEHLDKPVVLTGSQIPIFEARSDGQDNFQGAIIVAGNYQIPEVAIYFNHQLFRGNRTTKVSTQGLKAFTSPNMTPLVEFGTVIEVDWKSIFRSPISKTFSVHTNLNRNVGILRLFPSISIEMIRAYLHPPMEGVVLQSYGAGNIPINRMELLDELKAATDRGVIIVNITQCLQGSVNDDYETGRALLKVGVIPGGDMTLEAALAKLRYILGKEKHDLDTKRKLMMSNLRGEMTISEKIKLEHLNMMTALAQLAQLSSITDSNSVKNLFLPSVLCAAAAAGNVHSLALLQQYGGDLNCRDMEGRTLLHIAASEGKSEVAVYLLDHGSDLDAKDNNGRTPLDCAILKKKLNILTLLQQKGAKLNKSSMVIGEMLCSAAFNGDAVTIEALELAGADITSRDSCGRTALHQAVLGNHDICVNYLLFAGVSPHLRDALGFSSLDFAMKLGHQDFVKTFQKFLHPQLHTDYNSDGS